MAKRGKREVPANESNGAVRRAIRAPWLPFVLVLASLFAVYGDVVFAGKAFFLEDLTLYHHPMKKVVRDAVRSGEFPWWNPLVAAGQPLAANPAYELFYPGQWPVLVGDYNTMFQFHIVLHAFLAAFGMYLLIRSLGIGGLAAALGAVAYGAGGPMLSTTKLLPFMFALTWVPFILLFVRRFLTSGRRRDLAGAVFFSGLQLLIGEPVTVLQTWLIVGAYALWKITRETVTKERLAGVAGRLALVVALASTLAAVQILPAMDHARDSVRSRGLTWEIASSWSAPLQRPLEMVFPGLFRQIHDEQGVSLMRHMYGHDVPYIADLYVGLLPVLLALAFLLTEKSGRRWIVGGLVVLYTLSVGSHFPVFRLAYESGILKSIRYPEKFVLGMFVVVCILAAAGAQRLADGDVRIRKLAVILATIWLVVAVLGVLVGGGNVPLVPESRQRVGAVILGSRAYWLLAIPRGLLALAVLWGATLDRRRLAPVAVAVAVILSAAELGFEAREVAPVTDREFFAKPAVLDDLSGTRGRVYHRAETSWWQDHDRAALRLLEDERYVWPSLRQGAFPLIPTASSIPVVLNDDLDETFLLPTFEFREVWRGLRRSRPAAEAVLWQMAGVEWIGDFDPSTSGEEVVAGAFPVRFRKSGAGDRVWFASSVDAIRVPAELGERVATGNVSASEALTEALTFDPAPGRVEDLTERWSGLEARVEAEGRSFLIISITPHKYWAARIDGASAKLVRTNVGFQGLEVPGGAHTVTLEYFNPLVVAGGALSGLTLVLLAGLGLSTRSSFAAGAQPQ